MHTIFDGWCKNSSSLWWHSCSNAHRTLYDGAICSFLHLCFILILEAPSCLHISCVQLLRSSRKEVKLALKFLARSLGCLYPSLFYLSIIYLLLFTISFSPTHLSIAKNLQQRDCKSAKECTLLYFWFVCDAQLNLQEVARWWFDWVTRCCTKKEWQNLHLYSWSTPCSYDLMNTLLSYCWQWFYWKLETKLTNTFSVGTWATTPIH